MSLLDELLTSAVKSSYEKNKRKDNEPSILGALKDPQFLQDMKRGVLDSVNRGAVASTIGGPVDVATMLMRPLGYNVEKPVGGSEWVGDKMQQLGLLGDYRNPIAEAIASVAVPGAMTKAGQGLFKAEQAAIKNAQMPTPMNGALRNQAGAIVWHGSPHKFDKFDSSKIGTGEGAQAYGHGLYLAESPDVAGTYKAVGTDASYNRVTGGMTPMEEFAFDKASQGLKGEDLFSAMQQRYGGMLKSDADFDAFDQAIKKAEASAGNLYKVDLPDEQIAKMLDWDKPLSQQPTGKQLLQVADNPDLKWAMSWANPYFGNTDSFTAARLVSSLEGKIGPQATSDALRQAGIPGIRYLDGGSRGTGQGTSNFVVFPGNEDMLKILERNGQPMGLLDDAPKFTYPQDAALETARQNGVKMLGLPENNSPMDRAKALGFEDGHYHGTRADTNTLKAVRPNYGVQAIEQATGLRPVFTTDSGAQASEYALRKNGGKNASVYPLMVRRDGEVGYDFGNQEWIKNKQYLDPETTSGTLGGSEWLDTMPLYHWAKSEGAPTIRMEGVHDGAGLSHGFPSTVTAVVDPSRIRSRFAAFDPARVNENDLLAGAMPFGLLADEDMRAKFLGR